MKNLSTCISSTFTTRTTPSSTSQHLFMISVAETLLLCYYMACLVLLLGNEFLAARCLIAEPPR